MTLTSHIHRIALIAVIGCAILAGWTSAATARPVGEPGGLVGATTAEPPASSSREDRDPTLPLALAAVVLLIAGTGGYAIRVRTGRRAIA